jgi:hypothetical protein
MYLFNLVEKMFDGRLTLLVLDEAWLFLKNQIFADKIGEWLKVLRKKNVFVVFATQDVADVEKSPLKTTIIQQCLTKIYLADPGAVTAGMAPVYRAFGLTDAEIGVIAGAVMKRDYFYTSPLGRRLFQLDLGPLTLSLIGGADHELLDSLVAGKPRGIPLGAEILKRKGIDYKRFMGSDAPKEPDPVVNKNTEFGAPVITYTPPLAPLPPEKDPVRVDAVDIEKSRIVELFETLKALPERKNRDGSGRAAKVIAERFAVSQSTVYQARRILKEGSEELVEVSSRGEISIRAGYKKLQQEIGEKRKIVEQAS